MVLRRIEYIMTLKIKLCLVILSVGSLRVLKINILRFLHTLFFSISAYYFPNNFPLLPCRRNKLLSLSREREILLWKAIITFSNKINGT